LTSFSEVKVIEYHVLHSTYTPNKPLQNRAKSEEEDEKGKGRIQESPKESERRRETQKD